MADILGNAVIGALFGLLISLGFLNFDYWWIIGLGLILVFSIIGGLCGRYIAAEESTKYVETYTVVKTTIEEALDNEDLTGFERMQLVITATEYNQELADMQYTASKWYGSLMDKRILDLEYIKLDGGSNG